MFSKIGVSTAPIMKPISKRVTGESVLMDILTCEQSRSYFTTVRSAGQYQITNESIKTIVLDKLYSVVSNKISKMDIEFQEIMSSNGDYLKYKNFKTCDETVKALVALVKENRENLSVTAIDQLQCIFKAHDHLIANTKVFKDAFAYNVGPAKQYYFTIVASIIYATGFIITSMIDYERRNGMVDYKIIFKNENILERGMPKNMLETIRQFNMDIETNNIKKSVEAMKNVKPTVKSESSTLDSIKTLLSSQSFTTGLKYTAIGVATVIGLFMVPALIRYTIYFFMHSKVKLSEYFEHEAIFLELNVRRLKNVGTPVDQKVIEKQEASIAKLHAFAAKLSGDKYAAERAAANEIEAENRKVVQDSDKELKNGPKSNDDSSYDNSDIIL